MVWTDKSARAVQHGIPEGKVTFGGSCWDAYLAAKGGDGRRALQTGFELTIDVAVPAPPPGAPPPPPPPPLPDVGIDTSSAVSAALVYDCFGNSVEDGEALATEDLCGTPSAPSTLAATPCHPPFDYSCRRLTPRPAAGICGGTNACILCAAGSEQCPAGAPAEECPNAGCRPCAAGAVSDPGEACQQCADGGRCGASDRIPCPALVRAC
jgi:hypothetical protein